MLLRAHLALFAITLVSCRPARTWSPTQIDEMSAQCQRVTSQPSFDVHRLHGYNVGRLPEDDPPGTPVLIYGAPWCSACHIAKAYMQRRNIPFVEKDVELDPAIEVERIDTLTRAGLQSSPSLPVIEVRGLVMRGFFPCLVEAAWTST